MRNKRDVAIRTDLQFLSEGQVCALVRVARSTLRRWEALGRFPARRQLGPGRVGFVATEVEGWARSRPVAITVRAADGEART